jgi:putative membrane protein
MRILRISALAFGAYPRPAVAHGAEAHVLGWSFELEIIVPLLIALALYLVGAARLAKRSRKQGLPLRAGRFFAGWGILAGALVSPLHEAGEVSFTMHMIEHELIMLPAALLLVSAHPGPVILWALPPFARQMLAPVIRWPSWRVLATPVIATALQAAALIIWHMPPLFDRALGSKAWHIAQHMSLLVSALLFWWAIVRPHNQPGRLVAAVCLFVTSLVGGGLGALMALDGSPWYAGYTALGLALFGLSPAEDQQLAGLIMWIPGGLFHLGAALLLVRQALGSAPESLDQGIPGRRQRA